MYLFCNVYKISKHKHVFNLVYGLLVRIIDLLRFIHSNSNNLLGHYIYIYTLKYQHQIMIITLYYEKKNIHMTSTI